MKTVTPQTLTKFFNRKKKRMASEKRDFHVIFNAECAVFRG